MGMSTPIDRLPNLKGRNYTERITIPVSPDLKQKIVALKLKYQKDPNEWIRQIIGRELEALGIA